MPDRLAQLAIPGPVPPPSITITAGGMLTVVVGPNTYTMSGWDTLTPSTPAGGYHFLATTQTPPVFLSLDYHPSPVPQLAWELRPEYSLPAEYELRRNGVTVVAPGVIPPTATAYTGPEVAGALPGDNFELVARNAKGEDSRSVGT